MITKKLFLCFLVSFSIVLVSCKKEANALENDSKTEASAVSEDSVQPVKTEPELVALNPPHGQPNHRCDIAVGAPLNSPSNQTQPTQIQPIQTQQVPVNTTPSSAKPMTNPAHGQPFHRCDLAVGAPLPDA